MRRRRLKFGWKLLQTAALAAPCALVAVWGGFYASDAFEVLLAPGAPVAFTYASPKGPVTLRASSYAVDWRRRSALIARPEASTQAEGRIAWADRIEVSSEKADGPVMVVVQRPHLVLHRLSDGRIPLAEYLKRPQAKPGTTPFSVRIDHLDADVVDETGRGFRVAARSDKVVVDGIGDRWVASGAAELAGIGAVSVTASSDGKTWWTQARFSKLEVASLVRHLAYAPEGRGQAWLKDLSASGLTVSGSARLSMGSRLALLAPLAADASDFRYGDFAEADKAHFSGTITENGCTGILSAVASGASMKANGALGWARGLEIRARGTLTESASGSLPQALRKALGPRVKFRAGHFDGWAAYGEVGTQLAGSVSVASAVFPGEAVDRLSARVGFDHGAWRLTGATATWRGAKLTGDLVCDMKSRRLGGLLACASFPLKQSSGQVTLSGLARGTAAIGGVLDHPKVDFRASGPLRVAAEGQSFDQHGMATVVGSFVDGEILLRRATFEGPNATLSANGTLQPDSKRLRLNVSAIDVDLHQLGDDLRGALTANGVVAGKWDHPVAQGNMEVFGAGFRDFDFPFGHASFSADERGASVSEVELLQGMGAIRGRVATVWKGRTLSGELTARDVEVLAPLLGADGAGAISVDSGVLSGTWSDPTVDGESKAPNIQLYGRELSAAKADFSINRNRLIARSISAKLAGGAVSGQALYDLATGSGFADFQATGLALQPLIGNSSSVTVTGAVSASGDYVFDKTGLKSGRASGRVEDASVSGEVVGSGEWNVDTHGHRSVGSLSVGGVDRYVETKDFSFDADTQAVDGRVSAFLQTAQAVAALRRIFPDATIGPEWDLLTGSVAIDLSAKGKYDDPSIEGRLTAAGLAGAGTLLGTLRIDAERSDRVVHVGRLLWQNGPTQFSVTGDYDEKTKRVSGDGELHNFEPVNFSFIEPRLSTLNASVDASFSVDGTTDNPLVRGTLLAKREAPVLEAGTAKKAAFPVGGVMVGIPNMAVGSHDTLSLNLDNVQLSKSMVDDNHELHGGLIATGALNYRGVTGQLDAHLPFDFSSKLPEQDALITLELPTRPLDSIEEYAPSIKRGGAKGTVHGRLRLSGKPDAMKADGELAMEASRLEFRSLKTVLTDVGLKVALANGAVQADLTAKGDGGGDVKGRLTAAAPDLGGVLSAAGDGDWDALLGTAVQGALSVKAFNLDEKSAAGSVRSLVNADLAVAGSIGSPRVSGNVDLGETTAELGTLPTSDQPAPQYAIDPVFDVNLSMARRSLIRSSLAQLSVGGGGKLRGTLSQPDVAATLTVMGGVLKLPTARVTIEPGGRLTATYHVDPQGVAEGHVQMDLTGRTALTALAYGDVIQRYDVRLGVHGDMLSPSGLSLTAASDPPGLDQRRILELLGEKDILTALGSAVPGSQASKQLSQLVTTIALPIVFDPIGGQIASGLGLDYVSLEYNPFEQASFALAKRLGRRVTLQYRAQLSESATPGIKRRYEIKLNYRLPVRRGLLSRTSVSVGSDQDRPWKIAVEYDSRF